MTLGDVAMMIELAAKMLAVTKYGNISYLNIIVIETQYVCGCDM